MAAFCRQRHQEVLDELVELLIRIVHRISVRAEKHVVKELLSDLQRVHGKTALLFKLAEAALAYPRGIVNEVLYPIVGEPTLAALVKEYRAQGPAYRHQVHTLVRSSYSHHYRRMVPLMLDALTLPLEQRGLPTCDRRVSVAPRPSREPSADGGVRGRPR